MTIKMIEGAYYINRVNKPIGPMKQIKSIPDAWTDGLNRYRSNGMGGAATTPNLVRQLSLEPVEDVKPAPEKLVIKEGRYYLTRAGDVVGPATPIPGEMYPWIIGDILYSVGGLYYATTQSGHPKDLIAEAPAPEDDNLRYAEDQFVPVIGGWYLRRDGEVAGPLEGIAETGPSLRACGLFYNNSGQWITDEHSDYDLITQVRKPKGGV